MISSLPLIFQVSELKRLVCIQLSTNDVVNQVQELQQRDHPIQILQFPSIQIIIRQPVRSIPPRAVLVHHRDQQRARITPRRYRQPKQRRRRAPHALRRLVVEELQVPDRRERLRRPVKAVLRRQPENRNRDRRVSVVCQAVRRRGVLAPDFDEAGCQRGEERYAEADSDSCEEGDAAVEAGESARCGD